MAVESMARESKMSHPCKVFTSSFIAARAVERTNPKELVARARA